MASEVTADRWLRSVLAVAALWSAGLVVAALVAPIYRSSATSSAIAVAPATPVGVTTSGVVTTETKAAALNDSSATLVQVNGPKALALVAFPLVATAGVALSLARRRETANRGAGPLAWSVTGVLVMVSVLGLLTIGLFVLPVAVLLGVACSRTAGIRAGLPGPPAAKRRAA